MAGPQQTSPHVTAVVLAFGAEPWLERSVHALLGSRGATVDVVLVDNGCTDGGVERLRGTPGLAVVGNGENLGFSGGCNLGVSHATGDVIALVNGDLIVDADAVARLAEVVADPSVGIAAGSVRLAENRERLNTSGNVIHFLGFSWVGDLGEPATDKARARDVAGAMGALMALRREVWDVLGGFAPEYFAFHEDAELSWRCWQRGLRVRYVPDAIGLHRYEFDREHRKLYLAERNRLIFALTCWSSGMLAVLAPAFVLMELAVAAGAMTGGWFRDKLDGWRWLLTHRAWLRERRRLVQTTRSVPDRQLARLLSSRLDVRNYRMPAAVRPFDAVLSAYWWVARRLLP